MSEVFQLHHPPAESAPLVAEMDEASKWYGDVIGLNQVSLKIPTGITGLLGPNGAGKSTFLKLLTGQLQPSRGTVQVFGMDPWSNLDAYRVMGFCPDSEQLYEEMTGRKFVELIGRLAGYSSAESSRRAETQLDRVSMGQHSHRLIRGYSKGMRQRVRLAAALIYDPKLIVLDEPLNGLDPIGRIEMLEIFRQLAAEGRSVIVSSHILHEIENLTRHMIMLHRGRVLAEGDISEVRALIERQPLTLRISSPQPRLAASFIVGLESVTSVDFTENASKVMASGPSDDAPISTLTVRSTQPDSVLETLQTAAIEKRLEITAIEAMDENLDAIFHYLVEQS